MKPSNKPSLTTARGLDHAAIEEAAAAWLARREAGLSEVEHAEFTRWLEADPRHAAVAKELTAAWSYLQKPRFTGQAGEVLRGLAEEDRRQREARRRRRLGFSLAGLAAGLVLVLFWPGADGWRLPSAAVEHSIVTKPERHILADGSVVDCNAGAELSVDYSPQQRVVRLLRGEAHFQVAKEAARPFVVQAGAVSVRAVGTEFAVRFAPQVVGVLVTEGRVMVEQAEPERPVEAATVYVDAGGRATVWKEPAESRPPIQVEVVPPDVISQALAWRTMRVEFTNTPLAEAVRLFNQSNRLQLQLADRATGQLRISGIFWANDPEGFARLLESGAEIQTARVGEDRIVMSKAP